MKQAVQHSLFPSLSLPRPTTVRQRHTRRTTTLKRRAPLWLAIHLPQLSLEALLRGQVTSLPQAAIESSTSVARIHAADSRAVEEGIQPGMTLAAAWARLPQLEVHERDEEREQALLLRLSAWAHTFTPTVARDVQCLLLEVRGSLNLFNGAKALQCRVRNDLQRMGFDAATAVAPSARAAQWLARARVDTCLEDVAQLAGAVGALPLAATGFDAATLDKFQGIGARRVRDLLRLPRDGFARRYSARLLRELDQAMGRTPDVRLPVPLPRRFSTRIELLHEINDSERLLYPVRQMLHELYDYLHATQQGVSRLRLSLEHRDRSISEVMVGLAESTRDATRIENLVEQKFENLKLSAPVLQLVLQAQEMSALAGRDRALFSEQQDDNWPQLVERLRMRLGSDAVSSIEEYPDYRPERAWRYVLPGNVRETRGLPGRPQWLLEIPQALRIHKDRPSDECPLRILDGPERIETGWWDEADVARDYYIARDSHGRRVWICREVKSGRWWLQGIYA